MILTAALTRQRFLSFCKVGSGLNLGMLESIKCVQRSGTALTALLTSYESDNAQKANGVYSRKIGRTQRDFVSATRNPMNG